MKADFSRKMYPFALESTSIVSLEIEFVLAMVNIAVALLAESCVNTFLAQIS